MSERETCPKCGALLSHHFVNGDNYGVIWHCGSSDSLDGFAQSAQCVMRESELED